MILLFLENVQVNLELCPLSVLTTKSDKHEHGTLAFVNASDTNSHDQLNTKKWGVQLVSVDSLVN